MVWFVILWAVSGKKRCQKCNWIQRNRTIHGWTYCIAVSLHGGTNKKQTRYAPSTHYPWHSDTVNKITAENCMTDTCLQFLNVKQRTYGGKKSALNTNLQHISETNCVDIFYLLWKINNIRQLWKGKKKDVYTWHQFCTVRLLN